MNDLITASFLSGYFSWLSTMTPKCKFTMTKGQWWTFDEDPYLRHLEQVMKSN